MSDIHEQALPIPHCCEISNLQIVALLLIPQQWGKNSFLLSFTIEAGRSYFVHLAIEERLHWNAHLVLGHKIVAYFDAGLQNILV
jgi:hypothetical protein